MVHIQKKSYATPDLQDHILENITDETRFPFVSVYVVATAVFSQVTLSQSPVLFLNMILQVESQGNVVRNSKLHQFT